MPSEDRRAPPPVTRAGRKAAALEKRRRGRPRKDGIGSRAASPPPPPPKSRKKGRSRGQAQVEDEEGVDTADKTPPLHKTAAEVKTGRRGSASRRRSNTDPAPTITETPRSDPPVPLAPTSISEEEPPQSGVIAPPPPPHSPTPCPSAEMGGASLAPSPARSPRLRPEDDDAAAPSPLLRRSMSEESGSPTPSLGHTERRLQQCAFCYRGERPPLGQGPLVVFGPTPGYVPLHVLSRRTSPDRHGDCHDHCYPCGHTVHTTSSSPAQCDDESSFQLLEQLGAIGLPHDVDVQSLFDPTGQCCAHLQCAAWSEGVCRGEGQSLLYVDKAIDSASARVCVFCDGLGASLRCREAGCGRSYHFPCAAAAGAHQDWERRRTLCTRHAHAESRSCVSCSRSDDVGGLLMCCCCGNRYHARCLAPPLNPSSLIRAGWQCAPCRVCHSCRLREDTSVLLVCARCDKAYHAHCLTPPLDHTPDSKWTCQNCRLCLRCGARSSGHWANHPFLCVSCDPALPCGVCGHTPDLYSLQDYVICVCCFRCFHTRCISVEAGTSATKCDSKKYVCTACQPQRAKLAALAVILQSPAQNLLLTPTHTLDVQSPTEVLPISTTAHSTVQLSSSEQAQTPTDITRLSDENPVPLPFDATELQQSPTPSPSSPTEQRLSLVLSPSDPSEIQQSHSSPPSPTELNPRSQSSPSHATEPQERLSPEQTPSYPTELRLSLELSPSDPSELRQSPSSPPRPTELKPRSQSSPSHATEPQQRLSPEQTPPYPTELRLSLELSPSNPSELQESTVRVQLIAAESSSSNATDLRLSPAQSPPKPTDLQQSSEQSPANSTVLRQSPLASPANLTTLPHSPPSSLNHSEVHQSPYNTEPQASLEAPPFNPTQLGESPPQSPSEHTDLQPLKSHQAELQLSSPSSPSNTTEVQKSPVLSPSNTIDHQQSPMPSPNTTDPHLSPSPSPSNVTELHPSPVPLSSEPTDFQRSPVPSASNTELQQSQLPFSKVTEFQRSPAPSPSNPTELHLNLVPSSLKSTQVQQSPVPPPSDVKDLQLSPVQSPSNDTELQQSALPTSTFTELQQSPTPSPSSVSELHLIPVSSTSKPTEWSQSPVASPNTKDLHLSPTQSPCNAVALHPSPVPFPNITETQQSPTPSPYKITELQLSPVPSPCNISELPHSPVPSPSNVTEILQCPTPSPSKTTELQQSPVPSSSKPTEVQQNQVTSTTNVTELHQSPVPSLSNITQLQQSPAPSLSNVTEVPYRPTPSPSNIPDLQQSPTPSNFTELNQSSATSPNVTELHHGPATPPSHVTELQQSAATSASNVTELHHRPELHQSPATSPSNVTKLHQSPATSPSHVTELQQSPATSPSNVTELHQSPATSPSHVTELQQSPATSPSHVTDLHHSPAASPSHVTELQQSPATSPSNVTELHQSPAISLSHATELQQSPATSPSNVAELQQSPATSPSTVTEIHHNPATSPSNATELQPSPATSPSNATELQHSPPPSPSHVTLVHQNQVPSPSVTELPQRPLPSLSKSTALHQSPIPSPSDVANTKLHESPVSSPAIPTAVRLSPAPVPSVPAELDKSPMPLHSKATEQTQNSEEPQQLTAPSYPGGADHEEGALQPPPCPAELVTSPSYFETAELHECPAASQLCPIQVKKDPQVNHVPWNYEENHGCSPIAPPLPCVPLDLQQGAVLLTSTPSQLSPPSSPSIDSSREKLATRMSPKSPVWDRTLAELTSWRTADDEAKPEIISPDGRVQDDNTQLIRPHSPTDEQPPFQSHQERSFPEPVMSPRQCPKLVVQMAPEWESKCSRFIACKLEQDLSPGSEPSACRPSTAPGSPSRAPLSSAPCNPALPVSPAGTPSTQPAGPLQLRAVARQSVAQSTSGGTELRPGDIPPNPNMDGQTLESAVCTSATVMPATATLSRPQSEPLSPFGDLPSPAPASLAHQSTSVERSSPALVSCDAKTLEDVPGLIDCTLRCSKHQASPTHIPARASGARHGNPLQALCDLITEVTDPATVKPLPAGPSSPSRVGSPATSTDSPSSSDASSPPTAVSHPCQLSEFETGLASVGDVMHSPAVCVHDPELPKLPQSGPPSPLPVPTCSSPSETMPDHSTRASPAPVDGSSDSQGLIKIVSEASRSLSNQSSLQTCVRLRTCARARGSPTPTQVAETCLSSPAGSMHSSPEAAAQAASPEPNSLRHDSAPGSHPSRKTKRKSSSYQPGDSLAASQASVSYPRQFLAPLSLLNDRPAGSPTQQHGNMPETETATANCSQLARPLQSDDARIAESLEEPETAPVSHVHTRVQSESGPCPAGPTSAVLSERESTAIVTADQGKAVRLRRYLPEKTERELQDQVENEEQHREENKQPVQRQEEMKEQHQEENEVQRQEEIRSTRCLPSGLEQAVSSNDLQNKEDDDDLCVFHPSPGEPATASSSFSGPPSPSSASPSSSPPPSPASLQHGDVSSEASLLSVATGVPSQWPQEDCSCSRKMLKAAKDVGQSHAGYSEKDRSTPDAVAMRPNEEEARQSSSDGEGEPRPEPSLDEEVMKLMSSSSPGASPRRPSSLSPRPLNTRSLRPPPRSFPPSDELSIRLRQSPFSTEASPESSPIRVPLTPPPLSPPSPPLSFSPPYRESPPLCKTPSSTSTVIPLTRKIGMGKPAISKRTFSPGRARVRQASWWSNARAVSPPSSSQDSVGEGGLDSPKSRQADSPLWSMRAGRGSGFPGRRRSRGGGGVGGGRGGRGRSRIKTQDFVPVSPAFGFVESVPPKEEEENSMHNTVVMFSTCDVFTLRQDMCVVCGSFGQGAEGRLLACSQCGQCYHPYCVNVKVTRVILTKGWRCLECTVCEACGEATDPGRLLLCDDCDISYHTYCLDPPLHTVPKGAWKCKWCVWCVQCGSASPGLHCDWQSNYSRCGPCASLTCCPLCQRAYTHDDLILQCQQCDRWVHAVCEGLPTEDEVEVTADEGFDCSLCRTHNRSPYGISDTLDMAQILSRSREADTKTYSQDGVCLTESGLSQLQSLVEPLTSARRYRRCKPKLKLRIINQNSVSVLQTPPHTDAGHLECDLKSDSSPERELAPEDDVSKDMAKRKRKPYRPGIGGFMVRQRGGKAAAGAVKVCGGKRSSETLQGDADGAEQTVDNVKKRYRKKKTKLEEAFPSYLQEAFFGRDLLYRIRQVDQRMLSEAARISQSGAVDPNGPAPSEKLMKAKQERLPLSDEALVDLCDVLNTHPHIVAGGHAAGLDFSAVTHDPLVTSERTGSGGQGQKALHEEPLDAILNPELDMMVTDGALLSKLYKIPELEGKDVEDLFTAVLSPDGSQQHNQYTHAAAGGKTHTGAVPHLALLNGLAGRARNPDNLPGGPVCSSAPCPPSQPAAEGEHDGMSTAQRSMMKWEKEEALGERATVAPVLYCNTNFPQLREQYPEWSTRVKQIAKLWRKASSQDRAPYVQRARDNRAAQRINKVHMCGEPPKCAQPFPPALQEAYDAVCPDAADLASRDPLRPRESEQEQEWKLRQQMRQKSKQLAMMEASQKLEQVKSEQQRQQQQLSSNQRADVSPDARGHHNLPQGSSLADDVFLRPQAPPPSGYSSLPHSPRSPHSSPLQQPPTSPQMFSPPSSRPTSPWDPYSKPAGTPRAASVQACPPLSISPARDASGSPSPDSKASDASRMLAFQPGLQHSRAAMKSPPSGSQVYHRSQVQGGVFKAPKPPQNQLQPDLFGGTAPGARREPSRPAHLQQSQDPAFHAGLGTPRADLNQRMAEPFIQRSSLPDPPASGPHCDGSHIANAPPALSLDHLQMASGRRPASDLYPSLPVRFPQSPGGTLTSDPSVKVSGTPQPSPDPYAQRTSTPVLQKTPEAFGQAQAETLAPRLMRSPLDSETATRKQSPQQDSFAGSNQTPKCPGTSERRSAAAHVASGASPIDKVAAVGVASLEGPMGLLPQLGDSEEKLRQRQRLRQLILRQQQQKSVLRQEKDLQEAGTSPLTPGAATPRHWPRDAADASDVFGRPPPPYPGTLRLPGPAGVRPAAFLGEQLRDLTPKASPFPAQSATPLRFVPQDSFPRPPLASVPGAGLGASVQMRKPLPGELIAIRPLTAASPHPQVLSAAPQAFPVPRALPVQQHSIMGQHYIELRHRAPENRLRLPFTLEAPRPSQPVLLMVQMSQQDQRHLVQAALAQGNDAALQGAEGMEEHLEGVKDLEDVEVKDLVGLNLNLDPEDGKEDLDLGPNDLHLDDFLLSGKFDLIAYADPELNLEDKKDMFNDELALGESVGDPKKGGPRKMDHHADSMSQAKEENEERIQADAENRSAPLPPPPHPRKLPGPDGVFGLAQASEAAGSDQPGSALQHSKVKSGESVCGSGIFPETRAQETVPSCALSPALAPGRQSSFQQSASSANLATQAPRGVSGPRSLSLQLPQPGLLLNPQAQPLQREVSAPGQDQNKGKPLLLEEQPLLLQDLLDQERQEQQQQKRMQALIGHKPTSEPAILDLADFDSISDPITKAKMVALKGINKVMSQGNLGLNNMAINRFHQAPPPAAAAAAPAATSQPPLPVGQDADLNLQLTRPTPPSFGAGFVYDSQRRQYEEWLGETQRLLQMQQRLLEEQLAAHRKSKKALSAKQRTAKKAGRALAEDDAAQLRLVVEQQAAVQKQLEQIRKQQKDHTVLIEDYSSKQRQQRPPPNVPAAMLPQNAAPLQSGVQNVSPAWSPLMGPNLASQMPPALSTPPRVSAIVPAAAGFDSGVRGPAAGHGGASGGELSAPAPQVKFDDNNPFSEGFQERERRERLREQQEQHRVQLMQGVERHRMLQQHRLDADQQGGSRLCSAGPVVGGTLGTSPGGDALSQMPFFSSELPQDFLQSPPGTRPPMLGGQAGAPLSPPRQGFTGGLLPHEAGASPEQGGVLPGEAAPAILQSKARPPRSLAQVRPPGVLATPPNQAGQGHPFGLDSSSPSATLPFSSSSLPQLYADILPERRRSLNRDGGARTPLSAHSDDMTAPPTPASASCPTPTRGELADSGLPPSALAPSLELERQLSVFSAAQARGHLVSADAPRGLLCGMEVKEERGVPIKPECASPLHDPGKELLRHLLIEKASPNRTASSAGRIPPGLHHGLPGQNVRSEDEDSGGFPSNVTMDTPDVADSLARKKPQRCKRAARPDKEKNLSKCKRRRHEDEDDDALDCSTSPSERLATHLTQLSVLPLMEPVLGADLSLFPPYGSSSLGRDSETGLSGTFGNASLNGVADYYTQLACKNILGNPPTPPASLPPTPPPVAKQKLLNGFTAAEEVSGERAPSGGAALGPDLSPSHAPVKGAPASTGEELHRDVDVPASLPTPPHNNQEELRVRDSSGRGSPDGFVPSSSPESVSEVSRYPDLSFVKTEALSPCPSPPIPLMPVSWGKGSALKREVKTEPDRQAPPSCSNSDLVTIAITLNPAASQNVAGVMATVAKLLRMPASINYQLSGAPLDPLALLAGVSVPIPQASASGRGQRTAPPTGVRMDSVQRGSAPAVSKPPSCSFCKVLLGNGVRKIKEAKQDGCSSVLFCSPDCSALYSSGLKVGGVDEPAAPPPSQHRYANNISSIAVHSLPAAPARTAGASPPPRFPSASAVTMEIKPRVDILKVKVKLKPHPHAFSEGDDTCGKRTKSLRWRRWNANVALSRGPVSDKAVAVPTEEEVDVLLKKLGACLRPDPFTVDRRRCCFCHQLGDGETDGPARLLNLDLDLWVHLNCALWSSEVYETQAGALINVELALRRGLTLRCAHCQRTGATSGCNRLRCTNTYHFTCAVRAHCTFFKDKTMLCQLHRPRTGPASGGSPSWWAASPEAWARDPYDSELRCFAVFRRVYVQRDEARQVAAMVQRGERRHSFRVGSLLFCAVGRLLPCQMSAFHAAAAIFPVGYHANRIYWSMRHSHRRCKYLCFIEEQEARPLFKVKVVENGYADLVLSSPTPKGVWEQILDPVARLRSSSGMLKLFPDFLKGEDLFGLSASAVCRIIESLPGVEACERYTFRYGRNPLMEWPLAFNPSGSARSEPKASQAKRPFLLTSMAPRCQGSVGSIVGAVPGVISLSPGQMVAGAHQGRHSKLAQYRRMKADWKTNVYLARSRIQGLGLYAARDIEKCTMVIEYIGAIIRSEVANRKERLYESQNRGVYMFRIDNDYVIDATIAGGPARYINHSCAPNCMTEVVSIEKENKIIISSCRRIQRGEELSYDYKFDLEDDQHKIPCHCGAFNCRKWMN